MSERENAQLSGSDITGEDDGGDEDNNRLFSKSGLILLFGLIVGNYLGGLVAGPGALSGIGIRFLFILSIVLALDRILGVSRQWVPSG